MIGAFALLLASLTWAQYLWRIPRERIPRRPWGSLATMGIVAGIGAVGGTWWGWLAALLAVYFWFLTFTSGYRPATGLGVGAVIPEFELPTAGGGMARWSDWRGRRVLLKLYRGPW